MPLKMWFEHVVSNYITCKARRCWTTFSEYIIGGQGFLQKNMYQMQICPSICWYNHLLFSCRFLYSCVLCLENGHFCPPKCPRDIKGTKNKPLECLGNKRGTKLIFYSFVNYNVNLCKMLTIEVICCMLSKNRKNTFDLSSIDIQYVTKYYFPMQNIFLTPIYNLVNAWYIVY